MPAIEILFDCPACGKPDTEFTRADDDSMAVRSECNDCFNDKTLEGREKARERWEGRGK